MIDALGIEVREAAIYLMGIFPPSLIKPAVQKNALPIYL